MCKVKFENAEYIYSFHACVEAYYTFRPADRLPIPNGTNAF
jgi:hypothetical protein